jgi:hypothetical protein
MHKWMGCLRMEIIKERRGLARLEQRFAKRLANGDFVL